MADLSVLLATYNGARVLPRVLDGYVRLGADPESWRIVIVNNASTDDTARIIAAYQDRLPLVALQEPQPGKNAALNTGLSALAGDKVIVTDDDAIPQPGFLSAWRRAFDAMASFDVFGGAIELAFDVDPPAWMLRHELKFEELYAQRKNIAAGAISPDDIFGPNMAIRRAVFEAGVTFDASIGPNSDDAKYGMGSESEFCNRAYRLGHATAFTPEPCVHHIVRAKQVDPAYWSQRAYRLGRGVAVRHWLSGEAGPSTRPALVQLAADSLRMLQRVSRSVARHKPGKVERFRANWDYQFYCGYQDEHQARKRAQRAAEGA